jgi:hypothetical protein
MTSPAPSVVGLGLLVKMPAILSCSHPRSSGDMVEDISAHLADDRDVSLLDHGQATEPIL